MTWKTNIGTRVLDDPEQYLLVATLGFMLDVEGDDLPPLIGRNHPFDNLPNDKKIALLWKVTHYLTEDTREDVPELTMFLESAVYYIFRYLYEHYVVPHMEDNDEAFFREIDPEPNPLMDALRMCLDSYLRSGYDDEFMKDYPDWVEKRYPSNRADRELEKWKNTVEDMADRILWDRDFEECMFNLPSHAMRQLQIDSEYFADYQHDSKFPTRNVFQKCKNYLLDKERDLSERLFDANGKIFSTLMVHSSAGSSSDRKKSSAIEIKQETEQKAEKKKKSTKSQCESSSSSSKSVPTTKRATSNDSKTVVADQDPPKKRTKKQK